MRFGPEVLNSDLYALLDIPKSATTEEIRSAYKRWVMRSHPDLNPDDPDAEGRMAKVNVAARVLLNPAHRRAYDRSKGFNRSARSRSPGDSPRGWVHPVKRSPAILTQELRQKLALIHPWPKAPLSRIDDELGRWPTSRQTAFLMAALLAALLLIASAKPSNAQVFCNDDCSNQPTSAAHLHW